jgi:hypothetical protein
MDPYMLTNIPHIDVGIVLIMIAVGVTALIVKED